jgi:hypothetical protein
LGWYEQAYQLGQDTLTRCRRVLGDDHPDTLRTAHNLVATQQKLGQHKQPRSTESTNQIAHRT